MHRFHLPPEQCREPLLRLTGREAHHALHVLRLRRGECVFVLDGAGYEFRCEVAEVARESICLSVTEKNFVPPAPCHITLSQAVPKGRLIEDIIEKATELGVRRIVPILSERVATRLDGAGAAEKAAKWQHVAVEAIKQCGNPWLPEIGKPVTPEEFLARDEKFEMSLIASLQPASRNVRTIFCEFHDKHGRLPKSVCVWIGPEGDFTPGEIAEIQSAGALPVTFGGLVLRVETAAIYCLAVLNNELQSAR